MMTAQQKTEADECLSDMQRGRIQMAQTIINDIFYSDTTFTLRQALKFLQGPEFESLLDELKVGNFKLLKAPTFEKIVEDQQKTLRALNKKEEPVEADLSPFQVFLLKLVTDRPPSFADITVSEIIDKADEGAPGVSTNQIKNDIKYLLNKRYIRKVSVGHGASLRFAVGDKKP